MASLATTTLVATTLAAMTCVHAATDDSGWYLGANAGLARTDIDNAEITRDLLSRGFTPTAIDNDNSHFGYKLYGGYDFNPFFALEGGYFNLGGFNFTATTLPAGSLIGDLRAYGVNLDAVGSLPFTDKFSMFGRVGVNYAQTKIAFDGAGAVNVLEPSRRKRAPNLKLGVGFQYRFTQAVAMRVEAERYRVTDANHDKGDIDLFSLGLVYKFRRELPAPVAVALPPPVVQPPPPVAPPPPPPVVVPPPPRTQRYCSVLELQFDINKDDIKREDRERLRVLGEFLKKYPNSSAVIEGNTDNVGTDEANLRLSQRRAEGVVDYLASTFQIPRAQLRAVGYGETRPIADNRTEEGKRLNRRTEAVVECATDIEGLTVKEARMTMALQIEFDQNRAEVKSEYHNDLREVADFMKANPTVTATVEGHTGNLQATPELAVQISQQRAQNVVSYLADNFGIARTRLSAAGLGRSSQSAYNTSAQGQQENRRVNIIINYPR